MLNVGVLLRGKSLEKLPLISDKFEHCYIVNDYDAEIEMFKDCFKEKQIIQFSNSMSVTLLSASRYERFNIKKVIFAFTKSMLEERKRHILGEYQRRGVKELEFLDERYRPVTEKIKNTGVCCIFYVSEVVRPKTIWIIGLEFYKENYLVKENYPHQRPKTEKIKLEDSFIQIVRDYPNIQFNLVTYYKGLPKIKNLEILEL